MDLQAPLAGPSDVSVLLDEEGGGGGGRRERTAPPEGAGSCPRSESTESSEGAAAVTVLHLLEVSAIPTLAARPSVEPRYRPVRDEPMCLPLPGIYAAR